MDNEEGAALEMGQGRLGEKCEGVGGSMMDGEGGSVDKSFHLGARTVLLRNLLAKPRDDEGIRSSPPLSAVCTESNACCLGSSSSAHVQLHAQSPTTELSPVTEGELELVE